MADLLTQWRLDPLVAVLAAACALGYVRVRTAGARQGLRWPVHRDAVFGVGIVAAVWVGCGAAQARADQLMWVWMAQLLGLLLVVPIIVLAGQPVALLRAVRGPDAGLLRALKWPPVRLLVNPLVGPALVPVTFALLVFGGVGEAALTHVWLGWLVDVALLGLGALIALPLIDSGDDRTSLAIGLAIAVGFIELFMDAVPGLVLRFETHPMIGYFTLHSPPWSPGWLMNQKDAGGLLWIVAESLDLPFLAITLIAWVRADAREAARIDAELDGFAAAQPDTAQSVTAAAVRSAMANPSAAGAPRQSGDGDGEGSYDPVPDPVPTPVPDTAAEAGPAVRPRRDGLWWLDDPELRDRYRAR